MNPKRIVIYLVIVLAVGYGIFISAIILEGDGCIINCYEGEYKDGKKDGVWEEYHKNGRLFQKGTYKDNKKVGVWETYWDNGQLQSKMPYKNNKRDGDYETYYYNGQLKTKGTFKNDQFIKVERF